LIGSIYDENLVSEALIFWDLDYGWKNGVKLLGKMATSKKPVVSLVDINF